MSRNHSKPLFHFSTITQNVHRLSYYVLRKKFLLKFIQSFLTAQLSVLEELKTFCTLPHTCIHPTYFSILPLLVHLLPVAIVFLSYSKYGQNNVSERDCDVCVWGGGGWHSFHAALNGERASPIVQLLFDCIDRVKQNLKCRVQERSRQSTYTIVYHTYLLTHPYIHHTNFLALSVLICLLQTRSQLKLFVFIHKN